jgi:hypothetical protein
MSGILEGKKGVRQKKDKEQRSKIKIGEKKRREESLEKRREKSERLDIRVRISVPCKSLLFLSHYFKPPQHDILIHISHISHISHIPILKLQSLAGPLYSSCLQSLITIN